MAKAKIQYHGDINPEHGGYFYTLESVGDGFASVVKICPCSDAGLAENEFWIECGSVNFPQAESDEEKDILSVIGMTLDDVKAERGTPEYYATIINACIAYGKFDRESCDAVRIGKADQYARETLRDTDISVKLPHNAQIGNYARKVAREFF